MNYTVHGILQDRILKWVAVPFSRGSSQPRGQTQVSCIAGKFFTSWATKEAPVMNILTINILFIVFYFFLKIKNFQLEIKEILFYLDYLMFYFIIVSN